MWKKIIYIFHTMIDTNTKNKNTKVTRTNKRKISTKGMSPMCKQQKGANLERDDAAGQ